MTTAPTLPTPPLIEKCAFSFLSNPGYMPALYAFGVRYCEAAER
jgi:hypothetical protein